MGNCLITKLKGVVDNDNLLKLGEFSYVAQNVSLVSSEPGTGARLPISIRILDGGTFPNGEKTYLYPGDQSVILLSEVSKIAVKYDDNNIDTILLFDASKLNFADIKYVTSINGIYFSSPSEKSGILNGDLKDLSSHKFYGFSLVGQKTVTGDISNIKLLVPWSETQGGIDFRNTSGSGIYGDITSIASPYLKALNLWEASAGITGTLEGLVAALRVDRPTGSIKFNMTSDINVTFGGNHYTGDASYAGNGTDLVWTGNTITWNGITVNS